MQLRAVISQTLSLDVPLVLLFEQQTVEGLSTHIDDKGPALIPSRLLCSYPLSFAQERLLFIERFEQGTDAYHMPYLAKLTDPEEFERLLGALQQVLNRHPVLKTIYLNDGQNDRQTVLSDDIELQSHDLDGKDLASSVRGYIEQPFDLSSQGGVQLHRFYHNKKHEDQNQYLLILWHHIAFDGWAAQLFFKELENCYQGLELPPLDISYGDYALWQRKELGAKEGGDKRDLLMAYWQQQLAGFETLDLPTDHIRPAQFDYRGDSLKFALEPELSKQLQALAQQHKSSLYSVLLSGFYVTLASLTGQHDLVVGSPMDNRDHVQTQSLVGLFVNAQALRNKVDNRATISDLISQVHNTVMQAKVHQDLPFEQLVDALDIKRDRSRHPIFQIMFSLHEQLSDTLAQSVLPLESIELDKGIYNPAKFDLTVFLSTSQAGVISGDINFAVSLFERRTISNISEIFTRVLQAFVTDEHRLIGQIDLLSADQLAMLHSWNTPYKDVREEKTLVQLFEAQVAKTPDNIAVCYTINPFETDSLSYQQLNDRANRLAGAISRR
ncbi:MAG: condensation domain-containing protein, partial [Psychrosphaera sp.]|nr:condensation domain-containing protein [Psychrosphaera sp.]